MTFLGMGMADAERRSVSEFISGKQLGEEQLQALVGQPLSESGPAHGPDPVNMPMIRHWAAAFEDENPVYTDPAAAAGSRFGEIVAPPLMLQT